MVKRRAPNLRAEDLQAILAIIDGWEDPAPTWNLLIARIRVVLHVTYVRQTLNRYPELSQALRRRKAELASRVGRRAATGELKVATERLERLKAENNRLRAENDALIERFVKWAYNASLFGIDDEKLDQPMPPAART